MARAATTSDAFNAVAEPRRREILNYLALHERPVGEIVDSLRMEQPSVYELPVVKLIVTKEVNANGRSLMVRGVYVYWYVADGEVSASMSGAQRMWWMARDLARSGVLQRWAYITCFSVCYPGQEEATFERMKSFIAASLLPCRR